jgi:hypothetical protein
VTSIYNPCLLVSTDKQKFEIVRMQINDILFLASEEFATQEDKELKKTELTVKPQNKLEADLKLMFNRCVVTINTDGIV